MTLVSLLLLAAIAAVALILGLGLVNMARGGTADLSQRLMRLRVGLQFVVIALLVLGALLWGFQPQDGDAAVASHRGLSAPPFLAES